MVSKSNVTPALSHADTQLFRPPCEALCEINAKQRQKRCGVLSTCVSGKQQLAPVSSQVLLEFFLGFSQAWNCLQI
jgi:hypothetical protein